MVINYHMLIRPYALGVGGIGGWYPEIPMIIALSCFFTRCPLDAFRPRSWKDIAQECEDWLGPKAFFDSIGPFLVCRFCET